MGVADEDEDGASRRSAFDVFFCRTAYVLPLPRRRADVWEAWRVSLRKGGSVVSSAGTKMGQGPGYAGS